MNPKIKKTSAKGSVITESEFPAARKRLKTFLFLTGYYIKSLLLLKLKKEPFKGTPFGLPAFFNMLYSTLNEYDYGRTTSDNNKGKRINFESSAIDMLIKHFDSSDKVLDGSVINTSSEGLLYAMLLGKKYLDSEGFKEIFVFRTALTHSSVNRAADILGLQGINIGLKDSLNMSTADLELTAGAIRKKHKRPGIILILTLGYKETGTSDELRIITGKVKQLEKKYKLKFFIMVDAAYDGFLFPISDKYSPFDVPEISALVFDMHKQFFVPYTCSVILFRRKILKNINYGNGLFETRSSLKGLTLWSFLNSQGREGVQQIISNNLKYRNFLMEKLTLHISKEDIVSPLNGLYITLKVKGNIFEEFKKLESEFPLRCNHLNIKNKDLYFIKIYIFTGKGKQLYRDLAEKIGWIYSKK